RGVKVEDYVEAARAVGNPPLRIALRHILPNITAPLMVQATLAIAAAVIAEASLSFLGLGQQPPAPSWGSMLNTAKNFIDNAPWMAVWPGLAIFLLVLSFNLLGDGLRDALDPRQRGCLGAACGSRSRRSAERVAPGSQPVKALVPCDDSGERVERDLRSLRIRQRRANGKIRHGQGFTKQILAVC